MESMTDQEHLIKIKESNMVQVIDPLCQSTNAESKEITSDVQWLIEQAEKTERYENILHFIANIDTIFYLPDGTEREWDDKEPLKEIEKAVMPIWNEHCEKSRRRVNRLFENS